MVSPNLHSLLLSLLIVAVSVAIDNNETTVQPSSNPASNASLFQTTERPLRNETDENTTLESNDTYDYLNATTTETYNNSNVNNSTETTSSNVTTVKPGETTTRTTTTTTTTTTPAEIDLDSFNHTDFQLGPFCTCDLTPGSCDVNCCCDLDCNVEDISAFGDRCPRKSTDISPLEQRYCFHTEMLYSNNSQMRTIKKSGGDVLFCLLVDNLPEHAKFLDRDPIDNVTDFAKLKSRHRKFLFPEETLSSSSFGETEVVFEQKSYKSGSPVWTYDNGVSGDLGLLSLPVGLNSPDCNTFNPIRYMEDHSHHCHVSLDHTSDCSSIPELDANRLVRGFKVVKSPQSFFLPNTSSSISSTSENFVPILTRLCQSTTKCVDHAGGGESLPRPTSNCRNVLAGVKYEIHHQGVKGIVKVTATVDLKDFNDNNNNDVKQSFSYVHFWHRTDNSTLRKERSGNPGYLRGKRLITALVGPDEKIEEGKGGEVVGVTLMPSFAEGDCFSSEMSRRTSIMFGQNVRTGCTFRFTRETLSSSCGALRRNITATLIGSGGTDALSKVRVGAFGNTDPSTSINLDWVPILMDNPPENSGKGGSSSNGVCDNVVLSLHVEILFGHIGSTANPQAKVLGVRYRFGTPVDLRVRCVGTSSCDQVSSSSFSSAELSTSVSFVDVTRPAVERYKEFPIIEARFPHDFFYPFVTEYNGGARTVGGALRVITIVVAAAFAFLTSCPIV